MKVAILASGRGSNAENIIRSSREESWPTISCLITNNPQAKAISVAKEWGVPCFIVDDEEKMIKILQENGVQLVLLAGYMRILSKFFLQSFTGKVVNIHPSLLPAFPGLNAYQRAFQAKVTSSGVTVHFVDEGVDTGPIILQESFPRHEEDSLEDFMERGLRLEHRLYPLAIKKLREESC